MENYNIQIWNGEYLGEEISADTETDIQPFHTRDHNLVTTQVYNGGDTVYFVEIKDLNKFFKLHENSKLIFQNAPFDVSVLSKHTGMDLWYSYYDRDLIFDTKILWGLYTLATLGEVERKSSLKHICYKMLGEEIDKNESVRCTFDQYLGKPLSEIRPEHLKYAAEDAIYTYRCYKRLVGRIKPHDTMGNLLTMHTQVKGHLALDNIYKNGMGVDQYKRSQVMEEMNSELDVLKQKLALWGYVQGQPGVNDRYNDIIKKLGLSKLLPKTSKSGMFSRKEDDLKPFESYPFITDYLRHQYLSKALSFINDLNEDVVRGRFNPLLNTGRCIAKGQPIQVVGGIKNIEDIKVGDLVYSYSDKGNLEIKRVLNTFNQGFKKVLKINWRAIGSNNRGSLICTPDHKIKCRGPHGNPFFKDTSKKEGWYRADSLVKGDRMFHMTRSMSNGRHRIFSKDLDGVQEQIIIKEQIFKCMDHKKYHIHHKDHNKSNNKLHNLEVVEASRHSSEHNKGRRHPWKGQKFVNYSYDDMYSAYKEWYMGGKCPKEYSRISGICSRENISLRDISRHFRKGKEITLEMLINSSKMTTREAEKYIGLSFKTWKKLMSQHDICTNHVVESIEYIDEEVETFDIEVEDNHNFIASEICVHNCSMHSKNLQQLPRVGGIRECFIPKKEGNVFVDVDYSAIELVCLSQVLINKFGHSEMAELINSGKDLHYETASSIFKKPIKDITKDQRQFAKIANFGYPANMAPSTFVDYCKGYGLDITSAFSADVKEAWKKKYPEIEEFFKLPNNYKDIEIQTKDGDVYQTFKHTTITGRKRARATYTAFLNTHFQGLAADGMKLALYKILKAGHELVLVVHDQCVVECSKESSEEVLKDVERLMIEGMEEVVKDVKVTVEGQIIERFTK